MSAAILMMGMMGSCVSSAGLFYTCTDGTLNVSNLNANNCLSFLTSNCTPSVAVTDDYITCRYVEVRQEKLANVISLQDIGVYSVNGVKLNNAVLSATGLTSATELDKFDDDDTSAATMATTIDADNTAIDSVIIDLGSDKNVHKVVLKNTTVVADQAKICGAKVRLLRPRYHDEQGTTVYSATPVHTSPEITAVAATHTYKIKSDLTSNEWS